MNSSAVWVNNIDHNFLHRKPHKVETAENKKYTQTSVLNLVLDLEKCKRVNIDLAKEFIKSAGANSNFIQLMDEKLTPSCINFLCFNKDVLISSESYFLLCVKQ